MNTLLCFALAASLAADPVENIDRIIAHVGVIQADEANSRLAEAAFDKVVARLEATFVPPAESQAALGGRNCSASAEVDVCLAELARDTKAQAALLMVASVHTPEIILTGRLVAPSGEVLRPPATRRYPNAAGPGRSAALEAAFSKYIRDELGIGGMLEPLTNNPDPVAKGNGEVEPPDGQSHHREQPATAPNNKRLVSYALMGIGAVSLGAAGVIWLAAEPDRRTLEGRLDEHRTIRGGDDETLALHDDLTARARLATVLGVAGAAALAAGGTLFWLSRTSESAVVASATLHPGGAGIAIHGQF